MMVMFCLLPGGGGVKAVEALEKGALIIVCLIAVVGIVGLLAFALFSKCRHSKPEPLDLQNWDVTVAPKNCFRVQTDVEEAAPKPAPPPTVARLKHGNIAEQIRKIDWYQFEKLVALTYRKLGYTVESRGGANPDGGIDLIIQKDGGPIAVQCKHWQNWDVNVKTVREFVGALADSKIKTGVFVTLNGYTGDAKLLAERQNIAIINQTTLVKMLEQANVHSDPEFQKLLNDTRKLCPKCESELVIRKTKRGVNAGREFWGCSSYPKCYFQMPFRG